MTGMRSAKHGSKPWATVAACLLVWCLPFSHANGLDASRPRQPVTDARVLMIAAIESPDGEAYGTLAGEHAAAITRRFAATSSIHIDVTTLQRYAQPGCSRLEVTFWQDGVRLPGKLQPRRQTLALGINYCRDGHPPRSLD
jgi:hypothetical protein